MSVVLLRYIAIGAAAFMVFRFAPARATAPVPASARLVVTPCDNILGTAELIERLRGELLAAGVGHLEVGPPSDTQPTAEARHHAASLHVYFPECAADRGVVHLRISDRLTLKYVERALFVGDVSREARPRTLALAIAELLRATWLELLLTKPTVQGSEDGERETVVATLQESNPGPAPSAQESGQPAEDQDAYAERWFRPRLEWIAGSRFYPEGASGDLSSAISGSLALNRHLRVHGGGLVAGGGTNAARDVHLFQAAARVGIGLTGGKEYELELASVFEVGWAQLRGPRIRDTGGVMVIGALHATVRTRVVRGVDVLCGLQGGYVLTPLALSPAREDAASPFAVEENGMAGPVVGVLLGLSGIL